MTDDEFIEELKKNEQDSIKRYPIIEKASAKPESLIEALETVFEPATVYDLEITNCMRIFCDYEAYGIWDCDYYKDVEFSLSKNFCRLLCQWNNWYEYLIDSITSYNNFYYGNYAHSIKNIPEAIQREAILFCRVGLQIAQWLKLEYPQCKVFYLTEWAFDDMIRAEYELILDENGAFQYRCERLLR